MQRAIGAGFMSLPSNFRQFDPANIPAAVRYALQLAGDQVKLMEEVGLRPEGAAVLEIGPGSDFGPALILSSLGAKVTVADRFLSEWQPDYHAPFYRALAEAWNGPADQLWAAANGGYEATTLTRAAEPAEALASVASESMDFTYSVAVLEHVVDFGAVAAEMARVTKTGGYAAHSVDLRDHRDFSQPLEHLAMPERDFRHRANDSHFEFGNRYRPAEIEAHFQARGFAVLRQEKTIVAEPDYLAGFVPRLRRSRSAYRHWPANDLSAVSIWLQLTKHSGRHVELGGTMLELIDGLKAQTLAVIETEPFTPSATYQDIELSPQAMSGPEGHMWMIESDQIPWGDTADGIRLVPAALLEDGRPLGPAHYLHDAIRLKGEGRYSHWKNQVYFSSSDNTSPRENGRRYVLRTPSGG
jgi:SAM-dependent methyltransferase